MMKKSVQILLVMVLFITMEFTNADRHANMTLNNSETFGLFRAAHDASLQVKPDALSEGLIVFDRTKARETMMQTLSMNMGLKPDLKPKEDSYLTDPVEILFEDYVDDESGVSFPYNYRNDQYKIYKTIWGPAVIYEIRIKTPRSSTFSYDGYIYKNIIQEYPFPY